MKKNILGKLAICGLALQLVGLENASADDTTLKTDPEKTGYAFGMMLGNSLKHINVAVDSEVLGKAIKVQLTDAKPAMTPDEVMAVIHTLPTGGPTNLPPGDKNFKSVKEEVGYAVGINFGEYLQNRGLEASDLDVPDLTKGLQDMMEGKPLLLTTNDINTLFTALQPKLMAKQQAKAKAEGEKNLKEETEFFAKNATAPGVMVVTNGLQYTVITQGTGPTPKPTDSVKMNYRGTFLDGKQFDASPPGQPFSCNLAGGVIQGWLDVLRIMPVGSKWKVFISSDLAYGPEGRPGIPPNAALIFEMEMLSIDK